MKIKIGKRIVLNKICDCKFLKSFIGLMFRKSFSPYEAFLIYMPFDAMITSFFVRFNFIAIWLDKDYNILRIEKCIPNKLYSSVRNQKYVLELPNNFNKKIKKEDKVIFKL